MTSRYWELYWLAQLGAPVTDDDWGSLTQIEAENRFWHAVEEVYPGLGDHLTYSNLKAGTVELMNIALGHIAREDDKNPLFTEGT